ncbi:MAG TPA: hypothetical protein VJS92_07545, partial [Candidatus Polarisedimenticolaceae bacterium]|nr:hypothetical protein [Candidatus Polarisedimenticolaceae bacterium]
LGSLELLYDAADPLAGRVASRLRALMAPTGLRLELAGRDGAAVREKIARGTAALALIEHRPPVRDPLLGLQHTLWGLGAAAAPAFRQAAEACALVDDTARRESALHIEQDLTSAGRLAPLVRVRARLRARPGLAGLRAEASGRLDLD